MLDHEICYRAARSRDRRFDGWFCVGVTSTGIYCRPSCPARAPKRENMRFYPTAAAAQQAGFRACKRCRPDVVPGSPEWNQRGDVAGRAMRLIADGIVDREGVPGLARRLGYSARQLRRVLIAEAGAGPLALARAQRAHVARTLLETSALRVTDVAFAAGFSSVRQFNDAIRDVFAETPSDLRRRARSGPSAVGRALRLRLPYREPFSLDALLAFLGPRAIPGVEEVAGESYRRVLRLPHGLGMACVSRGDGAYVVLELELSDLSDLGAATSRMRRLLDLDADPVAVDGALSEDPLLRPLVALRPGLRVPGSVDPEELAVRAVLGQQVSIRAARTIAGRLAERYGTPLPHPKGGLRRAFPTSAALAQADPDDLPMPRARKRGVLGLARAFAQGVIPLDAGSDPSRVAKELMALPGIGEWTVSYVRMRALRDPDAFLQGDLGLRHALERFGEAGDPRSALERAERWRPWRAYALQHLWTSLDDPAESPERDVDRDRPIREE